MARRCAKPRAPDAKPCANGLFCNGSESCQDGLCASGSPPCSGSCDEGGDVCTGGGSCPAAPQVCRGATKSLLIVKDADDDGKDQVIWKWIKGTSTSQLEFGDPTDSAEYTFCFYAGASPVLIAETQIPAGSGWKVLVDKGYKYKETSASGLQRALVNGSDTGKAKALLKGKGAGLPELAMPIPLPEPVTAQLLNSSNGLCWVGEYSGAQVTRNANGQFKGKR